MNRMLVPFTLTLSVLTLLLLPATRAVAHDGARDGGIALHAPLDAVDCAATPPTITVLGLTIDVSTATIDGGDGGGEGDFHALKADEHEGSDGGDHEGGGDQGGGNGGGGCAALVVGQPVRVRLASDAAPLVATKVGHSGDDEGVALEAPLQAIDATAQTIALLGLTVDVSTATIAGTDGENDSQPIDLSQLVPGQLAEVHIDATKLPALVATELEVRNDFAVKLRAPLDAVDCAATPPTITVLGLTIDISTATIDVEGDDSEGDLVARSLSEHDGGDQEGGDGDDQGGDNAGGGCAALVVGQSVRVTLGSDAVPLVATKVKQGGDSEHVGVRAPLQAVDATAQTITVLGLTIDVSTAHLGGGDDENDGGGQPIDFGQVTPGQFAEVHLDATKLPALVATELETTNLGGEIDVEVDDPSGTEIDDPASDITVNVTETVTVRSAGRGIRGKVTKALHLRTVAHGSFRLSGLPAGSLKINVTRVHGGVTMARSQGARLKGNTVRRLRLRLRRVR